MAKKPKTGKEARERIEIILQRAQEKLASKGIDSRRFVHVNRDGSIDGELSVIGSRGLPSFDLLTEMDKSVPSGSPGLWFSSGARFAASRDEDNYSRFKGMQQLQTYYQRYTTGKRANNVQGTKIFTERVEKNQRRKVDSGFVRLHWNKRDKQPKKPLSKKEMKMLLRRGKKGKKGKKR